MMLFQCRLAALFTLVILVNLIYGDQVRDKKTNDNTAYTLKRLTRHVPSCNEQKYRTIDGTCNNPYNPLWGRSLTPYARFLPPDYADGKGAPRCRKDGSGLPNPRYVSISLAHDIPLESEHLSHMFMMWGQFMNHEITNKPEAKIKGGRGDEMKCCDRNGAWGHPDCYPIMLAPQDPYYGQQSVSCMEFTRSNSYRGSDFPVDYREQYNNNTHFIDGSNVYGSFDEDAFKLREHRGGRLQVTPYRHSKDLLPQGGKSCGREKCFAAGDFRANMFPALTSLHTLWVREHNRIANELSKMHSYWDDETIYQEARKIVGAEIQHITYNEYLPLVLGPENSKTWGLSLKRDGFYDGYDPHINPAIDNGFAAAAYRFGHSLVQWGFKRFTPDHVELVPSPALSTEFDNTSCIYRNEIDLLFLGLINQPARARDEYFTDQLTNHLFENRGIGHAQDLYALNIHRGRDNGIPSYNEWRSYCGLKKARDFSDLRGEIPDEVIHGLSKVYGSVDDVDLYPAGVSEYAIYNGIVGPTFACIIAQQFRNLKKGDKFWYENGHHKGAFTLDQLESIRRVTLARIICDNTDIIETIQPYTLKTPSESYFLRTKLNMHSVMLLKTIFIALCIVSQTEAINIRKILSEMVSDTVVFFNKFVHTRPNPHRDSDVYARIEPDPVPSCAKFPFRTMDGWCNNIENPNWGQALKPYARLLLPDYADGVDAPRVASDGGPLPGARLVSLKVARNLSVEHPAFSAMLIMWGQIINHDVTSKLDTPDVFDDCECNQDEDERHPDCLPIPVPPNDPFHGPAGRRCIIFVRSIPWMGSDIVFPFREQFNNNTSFIDASIVYASTEEEALKLRSFVGGELLTSRYKGRVLLPLANENLDVCEQGCFVGGDSRVNMIPTLTAIHIVLLREHNRICRVLSDMNPHWDDERLYQETRKIIIAQFQHVSYKEYLPLVIGQRAVKKYRVTLERHGYYEGYDPHINSAVFNVFATTAYRFGHSLIMSVFRKSDSYHMNLPTQPLSREFFFSPLMAEPGPGAVLLGSCNQRHQAMDRYFTEQVTNFLFDKPQMREGTRDLFAINVHRSRENGIPSYTAWRECCNLYVPKTFADLEGIMHPAVIHEFSRLYRDVDDIDLFAAGVAEFHDKDALVGPTFACLIGKQFGVLRNGDRFWYENGGQPGSFTPAQLQAIRKTTIARLFCDNDEDILTIQSQVLKVPEDSSQRIPCEFLDELDLSPWKEDYKK
uniref:Peroxidase n=1 Tax=Strigamia maritima TaxID=126957 RepID=T1J5V9_STRMM